MVTFPDFKVLFAFHLILNGVSFDFLQSFRLDDLLFKADVHFAVHEMVDLLQMV